MWQTLKGSISPQSEIGVLRIAVLAALVFDGSPDMSTPVLNKLLSIEGGHAFPLADLSIENLLKQDSRAVW